MQINMPITVMAQIILIIINICSTAPNIHMKVKSNCYLPLGLSLTGGEEGGCIVLSLLVAGESGIAAPSVGVSPSINNNKMNEVISTRSE